MTPPSADVSERANAAYGTLMAARRRARGWSQTQLSDELKHVIHRSYSQTTISQWERGEAEPPADVKAALTAILGDFAEEVSSLAAATSAGRTRATDSDAVRHRRERNLELWRTCVDLPDGFPSLQAPRGSAEVFLNSDRQAQVRSILEHTATAAGPTVVVSLASGHGVTTLAQHVYNAVVLGELRSAVVPASLWAGDVVGDDGAVCSGDRLREAFRRRLLLTLARKKWRRRAGAAGDELAEALAQPWASNLLAAAASNPVDEIPWDDEAFSGFARNGLAEIVTELSSKHGLFTSLHVDVSSLVDRSLSPMQKAAVADLFDLLGELQSDIATSSEGGGAHPSTFSVVAFVDQAQGRDILGMREQAGWEGSVAIDVRPFGPSEVFRMLMNHYGADLATKLRPELLVGLVDASIPLRHTEALLGQKIRECLDDFELVPYCIGSFAPDFG